MPRPRRPRSIGGEDNLAERIRREMTTRGWSYARLANAMKSAGCDINPASLQKSLAPKPGTSPRAIRVDEMIALAAVFQVSMTNLLTGVNLLDQDDVREALDDMDKADDLIGQAVQLMLSAEVTLYRTTRFGSPETRQTIIDGNQYWWKSTGPDKIAPRQASPDSVALSTEAIRDGIDDLKAIVSAIAMTWVGAEDDRQHGRKTPGPPIGSRPWADFMNHYLRQAHAEQGGEDE